MNWHESLPFLIGLVLQGEPVLFLWLIYSANQPACWIWICAIAVLFSNASFFTYYLLGYYGGHLPFLRIPVEKILKNLPLPRSNFTGGTILLIMRFLFKIRHPLAVFFGTIRFQRTRFLVFNLLGSLIWISFWFGIFYAFRSAVREYLQNYRDWIYRMYLILLPLWVISFVFYQRKKWMNRSETGKQVRGKSRGYEK